MTDGGRLQSGCGDAGEQKEEEEEMFCTQLWPFVNKNDDTGAEYGQRKKEKGKILSHRWCVVNGLAFH